MALYRFRRPLEPEYRTVVADEYERDGQTVVFRGVTEFDGEKRPRQRVVEQVAGVIQTIGCAGK